MTPTGVRCPQCGGRKFDVQKTTHRGETTVRVKRCRRCNHRIRTREAVESRSA